MPVGHLLELMGGVQQTGFGEIVPDNLQPHRQTGVVQRRHFILREHVIVDLQLINEARAEYNRVIPRATGVAEQTIQQAEGYALERVNRARGEADRFKKVYVEYSKAPEVTRRRLYLETLAAVLPEVGRKLVVDEKAGNIVPLLTLGERSRPAEGN